MICKDSIMRRGCLSLAWGRRLHFGLGRIVGVDALEELQDAALGFELEIIVISGGRGGQ